MVTSDDLLLLDVIADKQSHKGLWNYLDSVVMDSRPEQKKFIDSADEWQLEMCRHLIPMFEHAAGNLQSYDGPRMAFLTLPRGHDKTSLVARLALWAIAYSKNANQSIKVVAAASDVDQAKIYLDAATREAKANNWLWKHLKCIDYFIYNKENRQSNIEIISSDAYSASGYLADIYILDELTYWKKRDLFDMLLSGHGKRPNACFIVITNAGIIDSWQHKVMLLARQLTKYWYVDDKPGHRASWISKEENQSRAGIMMPAFARRVFGNEWTRPDEEGGYLTREEIETCIDLDGEAVRGERHHQYIVSMDYGSVKDRATSAIGHRHRGSLDVYLDALFVHQGSPESRTPIDVMIEWGEYALRNFSIEEMWLDPYQLESVAQHFEKKLTVRRYNFSTDGHPKVAENLKNVVLNKKIHLYKGAGILTLPDGTIEDLVDEMAALVVQPVGNQGRYRFNHRPGKHDDRTTSLALMAYGCTQLPVVAKPEVTIIDGAKPMPGSTPELPKTEDEKQAALYRELFDPNSNVWGHGESL